MKIKISELTGAALDWAVAEANETPIYRSGKTLTRMDMDGRHYWQPSTDWTQGGPIIEQNISRLEDLGDYGWEACGFGFSACGPTLLIAAMRCYVASELGGDVEVPEELT